MFQSLLCTEDMTLRGAGSPLLGGALCRGVNYLCAYLRHPDCGAGLGRSDTVAQSHTPMESGYLQAMVGCPVEHVLRYKVQILEYHWSE